MQDKRPMDMENDLSSLSGTPSELRSEFDKRQQWQVAQNTPARDQADDSLAAFTRERRKTTTVSAPGSEYWLP